MKTEDILTWIEKSRAEGKRVVHLKLEEDMLVLLADKRDGEVSVR